MNSDLQLQNSIRVLGKRTANIERMMNMLSKQDVWLTEKQVEEQYDFSSKTLQRMRANGTLNSKQFRCAKSGRKYQYLKSALEDLFQ